MIGFFILCGLIGVVCILVPVSPNRPPARKRLPASTRDHEPRLLALVERVEAEERRREGGCRLEQCAEHGKRWSDLALRKVVVHKATARAHELGIEVDKYSKSRNP